MKNKLQTRGLSHLLKLQTFFGSQKHYSKSNQTQQDFLEDLMLYNAKGYYPLSFIENLRLRCLILINVNVRNFHLDNNW
jgi:hypothetical protein